MSGKCLCGAVAYRATGLANIWYCHCAQCRALTGHYLAACRTARDRLEIVGEVVWAPHSMMCPAMVPAAMRSKSSNDQPNS